MAFERKSMEVIVQRMVDWTRGASTKFTDFRVGSRIRTMYEAVGLVVEEYYDRVHRAMKTMIEQNVYAAMGFEKQPAVYATGAVTFSRTTPADTNYLIPAGTIVRTRATATSAPVNFRTTVDAVIAVGQTSVTVPVICQTPGTVGNVDAGTITNFLTKPTGVDAVTNANPLSNGREEETPDEQKSRFQKFISSLSRGTLPAIEYGATTAVITDENGDVIERVVDARAFEFIPERLGEVDVYIWNGVGQASQDLIDEVQKILHGYYDSNGKPVYGYKPAGIMVTVYSASAADVYIRINIKPEDGVELEELKPYIEREIADFFSALKQGDTLIQTALETRVKLIDGIYDVKIELSTDGETYSYDNITAGTTEILVPHAPYTYELIS
jgi:uncharacterized phage protein gp47/JayE